MATLLSRSYHSESGKDSRVSKQDTRAEAATDEDHINIGSCRASGVDGTASLANRDFGRVLRPNQQKVVFSGAAKSANDAAIARYFGVLKGVSQR